MRRQQMQTRDELFKKIRDDRPDIDDADVINTWVDYLLQLKGCKLISAISQELNEAGWLAARTGGIGGSEIAAIMGESPWNSPRQIWMKKTGQFADSDSFQSEAARWGNILETAVATEWGKRNDRQWVHIPVTLVSEEYPWMIANIDGFTLSDDRKKITGILEIKTTSAFNNDAWEEGPLPYYYICQASWYCYITGQPMFDIVCLVGGQKLYAYQFPLDSALADRMLESGRNFWVKNVLGMTEPDITAGDLDSMKAIEIDTDAEPIVLADDESELLVESYIQIRDKMGALKKVKEAIYAQLFDKMGTAPSALTQTRVMTLSLTNRRSCNMDMLECNYPEAYKECVSSKVSKSLRIK